MPRSRLAPRRLQLAVLCAFALSGSLATDARRTLSVGARAVKFPGMTARRMLRVRLTDAHEGSSDTTVTYAGALVEVRFDRARDPQGVNQ
ncbi:MAG: hypothetical protein JF607_10725 [Burkholderiales bacterium]|nr:hypothetical protein [Burkholderiales bacterium]MBW8894005.1 hypothetical protein [Burkholderiales bacterium]